jgi:phosphoribosyl 1,2-cyclic phosphodiesterase
MSVNDVAVPAPPMWVRFWGVRGSISCPGLSTARYGGNTPCVEIRCGDDILIFDAGTGIRSLGLSLCKQAASKDLDIFLSHCHIDHVVGLPFFSPMFKENRVVRLWGGGLQPMGGVQEAVRQLMSFPLFPLQVESLRAKVEFHDFCIGDTIHPRPGIALRTGPLNHPGGATGYRIDYGERSIAYLTDTEIVDGPLDPALVALARGASIVILDTTYTDAEMPSHLGWGHSSWQQGIRLANEAGSGKLCLFHHDPEHDDAFMDSIASAADSARPGTIVASEGLRLDL